MTRRDYLTPGDVAAKGVASIEVACDRCDRRGRYRVAGLVAEIGRDGNLAEWLSRIAADCPRRRDMSDPCGAQIPILAQIF